MLPLPLEILFQPGLTNLGRLSARAPLSTQRPEDRISLDGTWRFQLVDRPLAAPNGWMNDDTSGTDWRDIAVPGVWTMQNTGDLPIYCNVLMPFADPHEPGAAPENNPTGLYRTRFNHDLDWTGRDIVLHIGGFESLVLVWCNGNFVGMAKDSRLPSEFDVTQHLQAVDNQLAIMVIKWSDATWIEDQDHWRHGGLHRSVFIEARGKTRIDDMIIVADFDPETGQGLLNLRAQVKGLSAGYQVAARLEDGNATVIAEMASTEVRQFPHDAGLMAQLTQSYAYPGHEAELSCVVTNAKPWSAEMPTRYRLITRLIDPDGKAIETHESWIGFRRVEVCDRRLLINGRPIVIIGVNRHDHHPENGKTPSLDDMRADLVSMKRHNINAIRTAHYPNDHRLLDLADELGFYVIDEANVECHARCKAVSNDPHYQAAIIERTQRMIQRDRNHPSIIGWSLGNESGHGPAHDGAAALARRLDPTRFVHYEGAIMDRFVSFWSDPTTTSQNPPSRSERNTTDLVCPMYPPIDFIVTWARWAEETKLDDRPLIMCEFSHAMGNSNGSISEYVDAFYAEPALGGGFIWEWRDHGLVKHDDQGRFFWAYGGHFGEARHDGNFCCDGLVGPDGTPHFGLKEYMWAARPVVATRLDGNAVRLTNRRIFADCEDLAFRWSVQKDGATVECGDLDIVLAANESQDIALPINTMISNDAEYHVTVQAKLKANTSWAEAGHLVAWDQLPLTELCTPIPPALFTPVTHGHSANGMDFQAGSLTISLDQHGGIGSVAHSGTTIITGDITACLWRAPTDNDGVQTMGDPIMPSRWREWLTWGLDKLKMGASLSHIDDNVLTFERTWHGNDGLMVIHRSRWILSDAGAHIDEEIAVPGSWTDIPRVGIRFEVPAGFERLSWFGLGPDESYNDRHGAQTVGQWASTVDDQYHAFPYPQEHGSHFAARSFAVTNEQEQGLRIALPNFSSFAARHHHDADLTRATTIADLVRRDTTEVHIDAAIRGMGTGACGPDTLPQYRVGAGVHRFSWVLRG